MGRHCHCCQQERSNESFGGGRGLRAKVCIKCRQTLGKKRVQEILTLHWIENLWRQSHVSAGNLSAIEKAIQENSNPKEKAFYALLLRVYQVCPFRKKRASRLRRDAPELYRECVQAGMFDDFDENEQDFYEVPGVTLDWDHDEEIPSPDDEWRWGIITPLNPNP